VSDTDVVVMAAEVRTDQTTTAEDRRSYRPTTLVMTFPPGELDELRRLLR
jgi:hypothetical protein